MTSTRPLTASERYARFVLSAWNKREFAELQTALTELSLKRPGNLPAAEYERMDLIQDLGQDLLMRDGSGQVVNGTDQSAALALVRHLAGCK
jgi:hypothetical protein